MKTNRLIVFFLFMLIVAAFAASPVYAQVDFTTNTPPGAEQTVEATVEETAAPVETEVVATLELTPVIEPEPEKPCGWRCWAQRLSEDLATRTEGMSPEFVLVLVAVVGAIILAIALPFGLILWKALPPVAKAMTYPAIDDGLLRRSQQLADQVNTLRTDDNPDNDFMIPFFVTSLTQNEDARQKFADEAAAAGLQVTFTRIDPPAPTVMG